MGLPCCASCHLKAILRRLKPSCLQAEEHEEINAVGAQGRQLTLEEYLYSSPSLEMEAIAVTPLRKHSPKVCPVNLEYSSQSYEHNSPNYNGSFSIDRISLRNSPSINGSFSIDRISLRSQNSIARRVSFRLPEADIHIIPARNESKDDSDSDESTEDGHEEGANAEKTHHVQAEACQI